MPLELLLGVLKPRKIDRRLFIAEEFGRRRLECVSRGEGGRNSVGRIGADGARKVRYAI